jgi:hypothetical protein
MIDGWRELGGLFPLHFGTEAAEIFNEMGVGAFDRIGVFDH